eukprot:m.137642 g.137642  ORF g.137642 m.137642 type:complete len:72 (-) comp13149_c0_seq4:1803-2018(-)
MQFIVVYVCMCLCDHVLDPGHSIIAKSKLGGCVISKTSKAIVIGVFKNPISVEQCVCEVERLVDYLISMQL